MNRRRFILSAVVSIWATTASIARPKTKVTIPPAAKASRYARQGANQGGHGHKHIALTPRQQRARTSSEHGRLVFNVARQKNVSMLRGGSGANLTKPNAPKITPKNRPKGMSRKTAIAMQKLQAFRAKRHRNSSFRNARVFDAMGDLAISKNRSSIKRWMMSNSKAPLPVNFRHTRTVGSVFQGAKNGVSTRGVTRQASSGTFILKKGGPDGYYVHTAMLN